RLTDSRQWVDREVQLHKLLALIMVSVGGWGLRRSVATKPAAAALDQGPAAPRSDVQGKAVAIMALVGGGMLFTHVHTVAPYANVAAGVYIAHVVMGTTALAIGAARILEDSLPRFRRGLALILATLLGFEGVLLVTYNEGLPWYIGYGRYNRWG